MSEENKAIIRRFYEALDRGDIVGASETYAFDAELHIPGLPEDPFGPEPVQQLFTAVRTAFPGIRTTVEDLVAEGDKVVARVSFHSPHQGSFIGPDPTAKMVTWTRIDVFRLFQGTIVEQWADRDDLGLLQQFGVVPPPIYARRPGVEMARREGESG